MVVTYIPPPVRPRFHARRYTRAPSQSLSVEESAWQQPIKIRSPADSVRGPGGIVAPGPYSHFPLSGEGSPLMLRASLFVLALGVCPAVYGQSPSSQVGAVPPPPWASVPAPAPAPAPAAPAMPSAQAPAMQAAPAAPMQALAAAPTILLVQLAPVAPVAMAAPAMAAFPSAQSPAAAFAQASPFVNPFVVQQQAQPVAQQGIGTGLLVGATLIADNPWIVDRVLGCIGEKLHKRGMPVLKVAPPGSVVAPAPASSPVMMAAQAPSPAAYAVPASVVIVPKTPSRTRLGKWFWGE